MSGASKLFSLFGEIGIEGVEGAKDDLKEVANEGEKTKDSLAKSFEEMGQKAGELGKNMALGVVGLATGAIAMVESTRELRQDLGKLETAFETTGQASGVATETFKTLYGILGEDDTSIEAANHLAMLTNNEQHLSEWTDILTGVYATFGDSLPLEGLAEAANETARTGAVTGGLADALNWAGVSEDDFNAKLEKCNTTAQREALIRETLTGLYNDASNTYKEVNGDVIANNEAQAELTLKMAEFGEILQPLVTKGKEFLVSVLTKLSPAITWVTNNLNILVPIVTGFLGTLFAMSLPSKIMGLIGTLKVLNATLIANPIGLVIMAIGLLVTAFVTLWNNCEGFRQFWIQLWENLKIAFEVVVEGIKIGIQAMADFFTGLWQNIQTGVEATKNFFVSLWEKTVEVFNAIVEGIRIAIQVIASIFDAAFQLITLPYRFIWENCKEYVFAAFEWIKEKIQLAVDFIKDLVQKGFGLVQKYIVDPVNKAKDKTAETFNAIKEKIQEKIDIVKEYIQTAFNFIKEKVVTPIKEAKDKVVETFNNIKSSVSTKVEEIKTNITTKFNEAKTKVTDTFNKVKEAITGPIDKAKEAVKNAVDKIKGFFDFKVELPNIKLPHFGITPSGWKLGDLMDGVVPKLGIEWYAKGAILDRPTAFGINGNNLMVGGEAGPEAIAPISELMKYTTAAVNGSNAGLESKLDVLIGLLTNYLPVLTQRQLVLDTGELVGAMAGPMDKALGDLAFKKGRGY